MAEDCLSNKCGKLGYKVIDDFPVWVCNVDDHIIESDPKTKECALKKSE